MGVNNREDSITVLNRFKSIRLDLIWGFGIVILYSIVTALHVLHDLSDAHKMMIYSSQTRGYCSSIIACIGA